MQPSFLRTRQRGFSLIEILIGIGIGMVGIMIVLQALKIWSAQNRTTTAGADAQINGSIAIYEIDRDIKLAGLGFGTAKGGALGCEVSAYNSTRGGVYPTPLFRMQAVTIEPDTDNGRDTVTVLYGNSNRLTSDTNFTSSTATSKEAFRQGGFNIGDVLVAASETVGMPCRMVAVTDNTNVDGKTLVHATGAWNDPSATNLPYASGQLYNLGPTPQRRVWRVRNSRLEWYNDLTVQPSQRDSRSQQVAEQIINLKALYGLASGAAGAGVVDTWATTAPDPSAVRAIRVGLLARSRQYERSLLPDGTCCVNVTTATPTWFGTDADAPFVVKNLDDSDASSVPVDDFNNWRRYRYRVYETIIPLRNVIWGAGTP